MNRRNAVKLLAVALAGATLGHWSIGYGAVKKLTENSNFDPDEQDLITAIADTIIPKQALYSALDLGVPVYLLAYFSKCIEPDVQQNIKLQLKALNTSAINLFELDFTHCPPNQRERLLLTFAESEIEGERVFFELIKAQTIQGFRTTREVMTNCYHYRVVPGLYKGCMDVNEPSIT